MGAEHYIYPELLFEGYLQLIEIYGARCCLHCELNAGAKVNRFDFPCKVLGHFAELLDPGYDEAGAVATVGHGHELYFIVLGEFPVFLGHAFVAFRTGHA